MKRIIVIAITLICSLLTFAQQTKDKAVKAETIQSFVAKSHPTEWYKEQADAWQKRVDENPKDEWAWRNLFLATYYHDQKNGNLNATDGKPLPTTLVLGRMKEAIPDSYTYHLMNTRMGGAATGSLARAIELIPDNAYGGDLSFLAARAWLNVNIINEDQMKQASSQVSSSALNDSHKERELSQQEAPTCTSILCDGINYSLLVSH